MTSKAKKKEKIDFIRTNTKTYLLRNTSHGLVKMPEEYWKAVGWKIGEEITIVESTCYVDGKNKDYKELVLTRIKDSPEDELDRWIDEIKNHKETE